MREGVHSALDTLFHHFAGYGIRYVYVAHKVIVVGAAAAAADKFCEAVLTALPREQAA